MDGADGGLRRAAQAHRRFRSSAGRAAPMPERADAESRRRRRRRRAPPPSLELFNGLGGFADDGREYVIAVDPAAPAAAAGALGRTSSRTRRSGSPRPSRHRLHLVGEQPRQPADAVAQRSGVAIRRARRCSSATRRAGAFWSATPLPAGGGSRTWSGTARATASTSTRATGIDLDACCCSCRRPSR